MYDSVTESLRIQKKKKKNFRYKSLSFGSYSKLLNFIISNIIFMYVYLVF